MFSSGCPSKQKRCKSTKAMNQNQEWIRLVDGKSFSRILYSNPVCFLSTCASASTLPRRNVMVVSWLSATNNRGRFMMSIHRSRHTSHILTTVTGDGSTTKSDFVLSVPIAGMEELVLNVGKMSGRWGSSKFPKDHDDVIHSPQNDAQPPKKQRRFSMGINGLKGTKLGTSEEKLEDDGESCAIQGTVAHLKCRIYCIPSRDEDLIDDDHDLFLAEITDAYVHSNYWDKRKKLFFPQLKPNKPPVPPYLTFLGSQTFGYINGRETENIKIREPSKNSTDRLVQPSSTL